MRRKIASGLLPKWFFDISPADSSMMVRLLYKDPTLVGIDQLAEVLPAFKTRKEIECELKAFIALSQKTVLSS